MLDAITHDTRRNIALAYKAGFTMPHMELDGKGYDRDYRYDIRNGIALNVPSDIEFDYCILWNGGEWKHPVLVINDRSLLAGGQGAVLPANLVTAIPARVHLVKQLKGIAEAIQEYDRYFRGWVTIRMVYHEDKLYYNHISFDTLPDYYHCFYKLYGYDNRDYFLLDYRDGKLPEPQGMAISARLYSYPYDPVANIEKVMPYLEKFELIEIDDCFIMTHYLPKVHIKDAWAELYKRLANRSMVHNGVCFNPDGGEKARMVYAALQKGRVIKTYKRF